MNAVAVLRVVSAGPLVSVQDRGRPGHLRHGITASGPMDRLAMAVANVAVGDDAADPAIEISAGGLVVEGVGAPLTVAVAGGGFDVRRGAHPMPSWCVCSLEPGDRLTVRAGSWGGWAYLAVAGRLQADRWLGSAATHSTSGLGGGTVVTGAELAVADPRHERERDGELEVPDIARPVGVARVVLGPQDHRFDASAVTALTTSAFELTSASDRMGLRLHGPELRVGDVLSIPSEAILRGSLQVTADGVATLLMADHQATGGYPKLGVVVDADLDRVAQLRPGDALRFETVTPAEALASTRTRTRALDELLTAVARPDRTLEQRLRRRNLVAGVVDGGADGADDAR